MKKIILLCCTFILFSCQSEAEKISERNAVIDSTISNLEKSFLTAQIDTIFQKNQFNGSVELFRDQTLVYQKINGFQDFETHKKLTHHSVFAIGSVSKQFTAVLVLLQQDLGRLKVTDKVSKYLPEFQNSNYENITIHQLLNHTSGLNDFAEPLLFKSGTDFNYCNKGYRFLGKLVAKVSGMSLEENLMKLFATLGMKNTYTATTFKGQNFSGAHIGSQNNSTAVALMPQRLAADDIGIAAGGILSTTQDLHLWYSALYQGKILKPETLKIMLTRSAKRDHPVLGNVGYGYGLMTNLQEPTAYFHTGYVQGSPSLLMYYPSTKTTVIVLSNIAEDSKGFDVIFKPHIELKNLVDALQISIENVQNNMKKSTIKK